MLKGELEKSQATSHWKRLGRVRYGTSVQTQTLRCKEQDHKHTEDCYWRRPQDATHFVLPEEFHGALGAKPKKLEIMLAFPELLQNFDVRRGMYNANGSRWCYSADGETATRQFKEMLPNPKKGNKLEERIIEKKIPCPGDECEFAKGGKCPPRAYFEFMIPKVYPKVGTFFTVVGSKVARRQMLAFMLALEGFCKLRPQGMYGIHLDFERELVVFNVDTHGDGKLNRIEKWIPKLSLAFDRLALPDKKILEPVIGQTFNLPEAVKAEDLEMNEEPEQGHIIDQEPQRA